MNLELKLKKYINYLTNWITKYVIKNRLNGVVIGMSGGIDSAVVAAIAKKNKNLKVYGYFIDIENSDLDYECIKQLEKNLDLNIQTVDLTSFYKLFCKHLGVNSKLSLSNIKPRLRMLSLYAYASENNCLVLGPSNADEIYMGYFTKFGDGGADLMPISRLNKSEILKIAKALNIPKIIIDRPPSASLYPNQSDEIEMGVKYSEIDAFLNSEFVASKSLKIINEFHKKNSHKFKMPLKPKTFNKKNEII